MGLFQHSKNVSTPDAGQSSSAAAQGSPAQQQPQSTSTTADRRVFLLVWPSGTQKAHWGVFVPHKDDKTWKAGKFYHVKGSVRDGFEFEIVRGWNIDKTRKRPHNPIELGWISDSLVVDIPSQNEKQFAEDTPRDSIDQFFASIPAPNPSLNSASAPLPGFGDSKRNVELSDCQWWVTKCVTALVDQGIMVPPLKGSAKGKKALETLADAPRH